MTGPAGSNEVAVIGLGNMGSALAEALLAKNYPLSVWNRSVSKSRPLADRGARVAETPAEAVRRADTIVMCLLDFDASQGVLRSKGMDAALAGKTLIQLTSLESSQSRTLSSWVRERQGHYLDGAILGYPADVRSGSVKIVYSGPRSVFDGVIEVLGALGKEALLVSEDVGVAPYTAAIIYARYYGVVFACLHAAAMAKAAGIPTKLFRELTDGGENWKWFGQVSSSFLDNVESNDHSTEEATLNIDSDEYNTIVKMCRDLGVDSRLHEVIEDVLCKAVAQGHGDHAISAITEVLMSDSGR